MLLAFFMMAVFIGAAVTSRFFIEGLHQILVMLADGL